MRAALAALPDWTAAALEPAMRSLAADLGWKHADLYTTLRVAITCRRISTPLFETMEILGREECVGRVDGAIRQATTLKE
jgi:glutamyl-tRNA synthetase